MLNSSYATASGMVGEPMADCKACCSACQLAVCIMLPTTQAVTGGNLLAAGWRCVLRSQPLAAVCACRRIACPTQVLLIAVPAAGLLLVHTLQELLCCCALTCRIGAWQSWSQTARRRGCVGVGVGGVTKGPMSIKQAARVSTRCAAQWSCAVHSTQPMHLAVHLPNRDLCIMAHSSKLCKG